MSSPPQETKTYDVDFSREQRWVVHHVLTKRVDDAIDDRSPPPKWAIELIETVEANRNAITDAQARRLHDALLDHVDDRSPPEDVAPASRLADRLKRLLEGD